MKVYSRTGDGGETSLLSGGRVRKDHVLVEAYGTVDELNAVLGLLRSEVLPEGVGERLARIQETLFAMGSALADPGGRVIHHPDTWSASRLENWIDAMDAELEPLAAFILPGGSRAAALAHLARVVCRRAERRVSAAEGLEGDLPPNVMPYLNRLSDTFFVLARFLNHRSGISETEWHPRSEG